MLASLTVTGAVITAAGIVLAATFATLAVLPLVVLAQLGTVVALGVLIGTLLVRSVLVPALAYDLDGRFWWPARLSPRTRGAGALRRDAQLTANPRTPVQSPRARQRSLPRACRATHRSTVEMTMDRLDDTVDHGPRPDSRDALIVEYGDYECPYSRQAFRAVERVESPARPTRVRFAFRHFPLTEIHPHALVASAAAEAAALQDRFWDMHALLFHLQKALEDAHLRGYAAELELDLERFDTDRASDVVLARIRRDVESGLATGEVLGTPTLFIDGVVHRGSYDAATLRQEVTTHDRVFHLDQIELLELPDPIDGCAECLPSGSQGFTCALPELRPDRLLRQLAQSARVARRAPSGHAVARSAEPGEDWSWCYVDEVAFAVEAR